MPQPHDARAGRGSRSTAAVLWLMMLLVFLPIASVHVAARWSAESTLAEPSPAPGSRAR